MRLKLWAAAIGLVVLPLIGAPAAVSAPRLYVPDYGNSRVHVFNQAANGALTEIAGSPFNAGGFPIGFGITPDGRRAVASLLVGNGVSAFTVGADGSLSAPDTALAKRTYAPAMSPDNVHVYLPTDDPMDMRGVFAFSLSAAGSLSPVGEGRFGNTIAYSVVVTPDGRFLYALLGGDIQRFSVQADGSLTALPTQLGGGCSDTDARISPDGRVLLLVCPMDDDVRSLAIGADGSLTPVGAPVPLAGMASIGPPAVSPDSRFFYAPAEETDVVGTFAIGADGSLSAVGAPVDAGTTGGVSAVAVSPDGRFLYARDSDNELVTMLIGPDGRPTLLPGAVPVSSGEPVSPVFAPVQPPVAALTATRAAPGKVVSFDASGSTDPDGTPVRWDWDFGDGTSAANAGPITTHSYDEAGVYTATVTLTDNSGCSTRLIHDGKNALCNGGPSATTTAVVDTLPAITRLKLRGKRIRYRLTEAARVTFTIARRKKNGRFKRVGRLKARGEAGPNRRKFARKLRGKRLKRGRYRITAVAVDPAGGKSAARRTRFKVRRR